MKIRVFADVFNTQFLCLLPFVYFYLIIYIIYIYIYILTIPVFCPELLLWFYDF